MKMQLLVLILSKVDSLPQMLSSFMGAGISGTTTIDCEGMLKVIGASDIEPPPIFGVLRQFLNPERPKGKLLLTVLSDEQVSTATKIIDDSLGGLEKPDTGILFTIPLDNVIGLSER
ncbi:MAG: hypothetical protein RR315_03095 [Oscillospiraceae bacterium]